MEKIKLENKDVYITNINNSQYKWYFIVNNNIVESAKILPPMELEYGARVNLNNLSEEALNRLGREEVDVDFLSEYIDKVETVLSNRYAAEDPEQSFLFGGWNIRNRLLKDHLGINMDDEEYSQEMKFDNVNEELELNFVLNYAMRPVSIRFHQKETKDEKDNSSRGILKPKGSFKP